jgi:hypothetical protein
VAGLAAETRFELRQLLQESKAGSYPGLFGLRVVIVRYAVIVRESGRSSIPRRLDSI